VESSLIDPIFSTWCSLLFQSARKNAMSAQSLKTKSSSAITQKLLTDHRRMRDLINELKPPLREICRRQASGQLKQVRETTQQLVQLMNIHAACEDNAIFPILSRHHPLPALEGEHDEILLKRAIVYSGILNYTFPEDCSDKLYNQAMEFLSLFERHMAKEERTIFPLIDESLSPEEKFLVLNRMEEIQAKPRIEPYSQADQPSSGFVRFYFPTDESVIQNNHIYSLETKGRRGRRKQ
jgi:hemerythrin-like domain-containing protein